MKRGPGLSKTEDTKVGAPSYLTAHVKFISQNAGQTHLAHPLWSVTFLFLLYFFPENFFPSSSAFSGAKCQLMDCIQAVKAFNSSYMPMITAYYGLLEAMEHAHCLTN